MTTEIPPQIPLTAGQYLGPATVLAVDGARVQIECPDAFPWAQMAIAPAYEPAVGDTVLAVGSGSQWYVIGVLAGSGVSRLTVPGDLILGAPHGRVEILAGEEVSLKSARLRFVAEDIEVVARHLLQKLQTLSQWIAGALHQRAGRVVTTVDGAHHLKAARISQRADGDVKVNGKSIHLN